MKENDTEWSFRMICRQILNGGKGVGTNLTFSNRECIISTEALRRK